MSIHIVIFIHPFSFELYFRIYSYWENYYHNAINNVNNNEIELVEKAKTNKDQPLPLIKGNHSLIPDMKFGWKPQINQGKPPIPLYFDFLEHPYWEFKEEDEIIYYGFRPRTSFELHEKFSNKNLPFAYPFNFPNHYKIGQFKYEGPFAKLARFSDNDWEREFTGMNPKLKDQKLIFNSTFESGNLDLVLKPWDKDNYYTCFIRPDTNSNGNLHWFYFSISGATNGQKITLNVANFTKYTSLFQQGLKPSIFSWQKYKSSNIGWHRAGEKLTYNKVVRRGRVFFSLEFEYEFQYDNDIVWFATSIPYTYSTLWKYLKSIESKIIEKKQNKVMNNRLSKLKRDYVIKPDKINSKKNKIWEIQELGTSLGGLSIPLLVITNFDCSKETMKKK